MLEIVRNTATVLGCISVAIGLICTLSKGFRHWISVLFSKKENREKHERSFNDMCTKLDCLIESNKDFKEKLLTDIEIQKEFARDQCRAVIKDIFYQYCDEKNIPLYAYKTASSVFTTYHDKLGGNSFICLLWQEIQKWEIDYSHSFEECE